MKEIFRIAASASSASSEISMVMFTGLPFVETVPSQISCPLISTLPDKNAPAAKRNSLLFSIVTLEICPFASTNALPSFLICAFATDPL